jgi:HlyD family secretion protein
MLKRSAAAAFALLALVLTGCEAPPAALQGYVEGEYVRVAAPVAGYLQELGVARGATVEAGTPLFVLEQAQEAANVTAADESIAAVRAQAEQAEAAFRLATATLQRLTELRAKGLASQEQVDAARSEHQRTQAQRREMAAQQRSATARLDQARWQLTHKSVAAPAAGLIDDTYYRVGEWVPAGAPVVSMLPPQNRVVRFFVPETVVGRLRPGSPVQVRIDGVAAPVAAVISYIAPRAEFTPPVIYSRDARAKLVFMVEARAAPADAAALHPGQPVDVELMP